MEKNRLQAVSILLIIIITLCSITEVNAAQKPYIKIGVTEIVIKEGASFEIKAKSSPKTVKVKFKTSNKKENFSG